MGKIEIIDVDIPFWRMVAFLVKLSFASVPATILVVLIWIIVLGPLVVVFL